MDVLWTYFGRTLDVRLAEPAGLAQARESAGPARALGHVVTMTRGAMPWGGRAHGNNRRPLSDTPPTWAFLEPSTKDALHLEMTARLRPSNSATWRGDGKDTTPWSTTQGYRYTCAASMPRDNGKAKTPQWLEIQGHAAPPSASCRPRGATARPSAARWRPCESSPAAARRPPTHLGAAPKPGRQQRADKRELSGCA